MHEHYTEPDEIDLGWRPLARRTRDMLSAFYGKSPDSDCLPDELDWCGHGFAEHAAAHIGSLRAIIQDMHDHLHDSELNRIATGIYEDKIGELRKESDHTHGCTPQ